MKSTGSSILLCLWGASASPQYSPTPFGHILSHCLHEVPNGAVSRGQPDGSTEVTAPNGDVTIIPKCDTRGGLDPLFRSSSPEAPSDKLSGLPPNYDGWLQYTALNVSRLGLKGGFDAFTNVMSVPDKPQRPADILYFFPGLQDIDWIPKVDPEPTRPIFDIIQPVLQYSGGFFGASWGVRSWYVTVNSGALMSGLMDVKEGDELLCNMTRTGDTSWIVKAALKSDPSKSVVQEAHNDRLKLQPWAYNTLECYGCNGCNTYPKKSITFTENKLYQAGKLIDIPKGAWLSNPKPAKKLECAESTHIADNGDTTISFVSSSDSVVV